MSRLTHIRQETVVEGVNVTAGLSGASITISNVSEESCQSSEDTIQTWFQMFYSTSYWLTFVRLIFINKYNIQMSWVQSNWTDCREREFPERPRPQWEETLGSGGILSFGVSFDRLQSNLKQRSRSPPQLCGDLTHTDTPVDLIGSVSAVITCSVLTSHPGPACSEKPRRTLN